jgi:site-specific recombinase XerD
LGRLEAPDRKPLPFAELVEHFAAWMREQRGLSEVTIGNRCWHARRFLNWLDGENRLFEQVSLQELDAFLSLQAVQGWGRVSVATSARALRSFFRHAELHAWCAKGLAAGIDGPRIFKQEGLPVGPTWPDVERLLATARGDRPREIRDYAILLLFALYAFRSGEVAALQLEDLHWDRELIVLTRPKQRRAQEYPLVPAAGEAILHYLQRLRHPDLRQSGFGRPARSGQLPPRRSRMKLAAVVSTYVTHKQSMGMRFCTEARTLEAFYRAMGDIDITEVRRDRVDAYLAGKGPVTRFWQRKHEVLVGFYRFVIARGYALHVPAAPPST